MRELLDALHRHARAAPRRPAISDGTTQLDYVGLARRVWGVAGWLAGLPKQDAGGPAARPVVGLLGGNCADWVVAQLAAWHAGLTVVPLPPFFSRSQLIHVIADAGVIHVLSVAGTAQAVDLGRPHLRVPDCVADRPPAGSDAGTAQIIYTSGSTGAPKGVCHGARQLLWSARALAEAIAAGPDDHYLSVVPLALLLETLCAIAVPLLAGGRVTLVPALTAGFGAAAPLPMASIVDAVRPSCLVLVPHLLAAWTDELVQSGRRAPDGLRLVAVGGSAVAPSLARRAWAFGIPVHEGYGLSECCSVVALNRPGARRAGTVGRALPGLDVSVEAGEIVVRGPSLMQGYLGRPSQGGGPVAWRTGDHGTIDADGYLSVHGRLDNLILTPWGRNISPEWIETLVLGDPRVGLCMLAGGPDTDLALLLSPSAAGRSWFERATPDQVQSLIEGCCADVPAHAQPRRHIVVPLAELAARGLLTGNGRIRRQPAAAAYQASLAPALPSLSPP